MPKLENLIGKHFDKLEVIELLPSDKNGQRRWLCKCECGNTHIATTGNLKSGHTTNCGCKKSPDLTGQTFGKLMVLGRSEKRNSRGARTTPMWECQCECGNITYKATDTLKNEEESMCSECQGKFAASIMRVAAGYVGGTQISRIKSDKLISTNTSGCRGVYYDKKTNKYRARLKFKGKIMNFGSYENFEDAVAARKAAEQEYYGSFLEEIGQAE